MLACMLLALAGFLTFGDRTLGNVLNNFPVDNTMVNIARLCFGLNMLTTLPLEAFVCREVMLNYYFPGEPFNMHLHLIFSTSLVVSAMTLSIITCDLGVIFELVGATSACAMAYILPPLCYIKLTSRSWKHTSPPPSSPSAAQSWALASFRPCRRSSVVSHDSLPLRSDTEFLPLLRLFADSYNFVRRPRHGGQMHVTVV